MVFPANCLIDACRGNNAFNYGPFMIYYFIDSHSKYEVIMKILTMMLIVDMVWFFLLMTLWANNLDMMFCPFK